MKHTLTRCLLIGIVLVSQWSVASDGIKMTEYYFIKIETNNLSGRVLFNEISVFDIDGGYTETDVPLNLWVKPKVNSLSTAFSVVNNDSPWEIKLLFYKHKKSEDFPTPDVVYFEKKYSKDPALLNKNFNVDSDLVVNTKLWEQAERVSQVSEGDIDSMIAIANSLASSVVAGDLEKAVSLIDYKINEDSLADGKPKERLMNAAKMGYKMISEESAVSVSVVSKDSAKVSLLNSGQLVLLERDIDQSSIPSISDAIHFEHEEFSFSIPLYFSKLSGKWQISR